MLRFFRLNCLCLYFVISCVWWRIICEETLNYTYQCTKCYGQKWNQCVVFLMTKFCWKINKCTLALWLTNICMFPADICCIHRKTVNENLKWISGWEIIDWTLPVILPPQTPSGLLMIPSCCTQLCTVAPTLWLCPVMRWGTTGFCWVPGWAKCLPSGREVIRCMLMAWIRRATMSTCG